MFHTELELRALPGERWRVQAPLLWRDDELEVAVPAGAVTDLASIPRVLQWLPHFGVNGRSRRPATLHDYLYLLAARRLNGWTKAAADSLFRRALAAEGLNRGTCALYYYAVRWFGRPRA
jgi:hypothetical protein